MKRRIGILTSGGDCPGLNAAIRGVAARGCMNCLTRRSSASETAIGGLIKGDYQEMQQQPVLRHPDAWAAPFWAPARTPFRNMQVIERRQRGQGCRHEKDLQGR